MIGNAKIVQFLEDEFHFILQCRLHTELRIQNILKNTIGKDRIYQNLLHYLIWKMKLKIRNLFMYIFKAFNL